MPLRGALLLGAAAALQAPARVQTARKAAVALDAGIDLRYDCKMGVCMMCPAKVVTGEIDQSGSMVSEDVAEAGYTLLCCAKPESDGVVIQTVSEDELLDAQFGA